MLLFGGPFTVVLGVAQDAGHPHPGCQRPCCRAAWEEPAERHRVACLGIVDPEAGSAWLIDATPDLPAQLHALQELVPGVELEGVLLTHGHIGHYLGLVYLGREAMASQQVPVYAMPRMRELLEAGAPWRNLIELGSIEVRPLEEAVGVPLGSRLTVTPVPVPHRSEDTETVGFVIRGPSQSVLYVPDTDRWEGWETGLDEHLREVDVAWLDGTFFDEEELHGRDQQEVPHPVVSHTLTWLEDQPVDARTKVRLIHLNHTNPLLDPRSEASARVAHAGVRVATEGERVEL